MAFVTLNADSYSGTYYCVETGSSPYYESIASYNDSSYVRHDNHFSSEATIGLNASLSDFDYATGVTLQIRHRLADTWSNDENPLQARIMTSDLGTVLAAADSGGAHQTIVADGEHNSTSFATLTADAFSYVNGSATQAQWNDAVLQLGVPYYNKIGGWDNAYHEVSAFDVVVTYTQSGPPATINPVESTSTTASDTAQLTVSYLPMTVNPVESSSVTASDTAQLTATWTSPATINPVESASVTVSDVAQLTVTTPQPPMTVNPIGSTSLSASDTAQLSSPGTPLAVSDLAGTPGSNGAVNLTWSEPVGVQ